MSSWPARNCSTSCGVSPSAAAEPGSARDSSGEDDGSVKGLGEPALPGGGDDVAGDHPRGGAVGVVTVEGLDGVVVGDVADPALESNGLPTLLDLRSLRMSTSPSTDTPWTLSLSLNVPPCTRSSRETDS
jgi:hypothetical protein